MKTPTFGEIKQALPTIVKLSGFLATAGIFATTGSSGLDTQLVNSLGFQGDEANSTAEFISDLAGVGVEITAGYAADYLKNIGSIFKNGIHESLYEALKQAVKEAVPELRLEMLEHYNEVDDETRRAISRLFDNLQQINFKDLDITDDEIEAFTLHNYEFFGQIFARPYDTWNRAYETVKAIPNDFQQAIACSFAIVVTKKLHELLKKDENKGALIDYGIHLMEQNARISNNNNEHLIIIEGILHKILTNQNVYGDRVLSIRETLRSIHTDLKFLCNKINDRLHKIETIASDINQPMLYIPLSMYNQAGSGFDYSFKSQYTSFIGRKEDQNQIWEFFYHDDSLIEFKWWVLVGSGGAGKSRLAFEVCNSFRNSGHYAGFINDIKGFDKWDVWQPEKPTFVVIDYAATDIDKLADIIKTLHRRNQAGRRLNYPVRFLLIERNISGNWYNYLKENQEIMSCCYLNRQQQVLELSIFMPLDLLEMIKEIHVKKNKLEKYYTYNERWLIENFMRIDHQVRPLFGFFYGMALANGANPRNWDSEQLLNYIADDKKRFWERGGNKTLAYKHENILFLSTLCGGLSLSDIDKLLEKGISHLPIKEELDLDLLDAMSGIEGNDENMFFLPYLPDILGEFFCLNKVEKAFGKRSPFNESKKLKQLILEAWKIRPQFIIFFTLRSFYDFPSKRKFLKCFYTIKISELEEKPKETWTYLLGDLINYYTKNKDFENAEDVYQTIKTLKPEEKKVSILIGQSICAFNLIVGYSKRDNWDIIESLGKVKNTTFHPKAWEIYLDFCSINNFTLEEVAYRHLKACPVILNCIVVSNNYDIEKALWVYEEAKKITNIFPLEHFYNQQAQCLYRLIFVASGNHEAIPKLEQEIRKFYIIYSQYQSQELLFHIDLLVNAIVQSVCNSSLEKWKIKELIEFHLKTLKNLYGSDKIGNSMTLKTGMLSMFLEKAGINVEI